MPAAAWQPSLIDEYVERIIAHYERTGQPERTAKWRARKLDIGFPTEVFAR
jgi:hypothetical protein